MIILETGLQVRSDGGMDLISDGSRELDWGGKEHDRERIG